MNAQRLSRMSLAIFGGIVVVLALLALLSRPISDAQARPISLKPQTAISGTITLWYDYNPGGSEESALMQVISVAQTANPSATITAVNIPFDQILYLYQTQVQAGDGPDMFIFPNDSLGDQVRSGIIRNLDSYLQDRLGQVYTSAVDGMKVGGQLYGVPESAKAVALYYNKAHISTPPTTTAALLAAVQGGKTIVLNQNAYHSFGFWGAFGGHLLGANGQCIADQGGFSAAMQYLLNLKQAGATFTVDGSQADSLFTSGAVDMIINGPWVLNDYKAILGSNLGVTLMPASPINPASPLNGIDGFYINPNTHNFTSTVELALFMTNQSSSQVFTDVGGHVPIRSDVSSSDPLINTFAQASAQGFPRPQSSVFFNYWGPFDDMLNNVLDGGISPMNAVNDACAIMNGLDRIVPFTTPISGTLTIWNGYSIFGSEDAAFRQVISTARSIYSTTVIKVQPVPYDLLFDDYQTHVISGGGPDMYIGPNDVLGNQARAGVIRNLNGYLQGRLGPVYTSAIDGMKVSDQLYGVPESAKAVALYYNKAHISTPPADIAALLALIKSGKKIVLNQTAYHLFGFWGAFGGQLMAADGRCIADRGGFAPAMQYLVDLKQAGGIFTSDEAQADSLFTSGSVDMIINGPWALNDYKAALGTNLGVTLMPAGPVNPASPLNGIDGYYVNPNTEDFTSTVELALYMTNHASSQAFTDVGGHIPVRTDVTSSDPLINTFAQASAQGFPRPQSTQFSNYWGPFGDMVNDVLNGLVSPTTGVMIACDTMNQLNGSPVYKVYLPMLRR